MINARPQKNLKAAKEYFRKHLARGDYYSQGRTIAGAWLGKGVARLGLDPAQPVSEKAFIRLCENRHPLTGAQLTVRRRLKNRRVFYDFVASAPKSVSIMALTAGDSRILAAHDEACRIAMQSLEELAGTRIRKGGQRAERNTGEFVGACFRHEESRALDPQLHTHVVIFNATWDPVEKRWKALETSAMYEQINLHTEVYRSELALRLRALGYQLRNTANGFEIEGVAPNLIERFSKRRRSILAAEATIVAAKGKTLSNNERAAVARGTRPAKRKDLSPDDIIAQQRTQLSADELAALEKLARSPVTAVAQSESPCLGLTLGQDTGLTGPHGRGALPAPGSFVTAEAAREAIDYARDHLFERASVVARYELLEEALKFGRGRVNLPALQAELRRRSEFIQVGDELTTREALLLEQHMIALVNQGLGGCKPLRPDFRAGGKLTPEQRQALEFILHSPDEVIALRGRAGTGKTRLLQELVRGIEEKHKTVVLAPTSAAVEVLRGQGFKQAATLQRFLADAEFQQRSTGKAIIVDEAGFLSLHNMVTLVEATRTLRSRLILSGDTRQHSGVEAGDALRILEEHSRLRPVELKNIQRQVDREYREAVRELSQGKGTAALQRLDRIGAVIEQPDETRYLSLAEHYVASVKSGKSALLVSPTWREIEQVTGEVRHRLKEEKLLGAHEVPVKAHDPLKWTLAQKRDLRNYQPGMVLTFHKATKDFCAGEWAELNRVQAGNLQLTKPDGKSAYVTKKQAACFEVAKKCELKVAAGERLLLQGNRKEAKLFNGQIVIVKQVEPDGSITLSDKRRLPADFRAFTYGYCVTSHASQARTVDHAYVAVDSHTLVAANLKQFYVSTSRAREQVKIFTDDKAILHDEVRDSGVRLSATELVESARLAARATQAEQQSIRVKI